MDLESHHKNHLIVASTPNACSLEDIWLTSRCDFSEEAYCAAVKNIRAQSLGTRFEFDELEYVKKVLTRPAVVPPRRHPTGDEVACRVP